MKFLRYSFLIPGLLVVASWACAQSGPENLVLAFANLASLDEAAEGHYEGWAIVDGAPVSTGVFNVNESGMPVELGGGGIIDEFTAGQDISQATSIKISIEPSGDADPAPSGLIILDGEVAAHQASLVVNVPDRQVLETMTAGSFILATPSDNDVEPDNDDQGIWFLTMPGPAAGFQNLPDLGPNWIYEGWVVDVSYPAGPVPYSTGTFAMAEGADSDAAGCLGGGPPFPGQDFTAYHCDAVLDLDSGDFAAVVSIEPVPDTGSGPFQLKPLAGAIPTDALGMNNELQNQAAATFPTGMAFLSQVVANDNASWGAIKVRYK